MEPMTHFMTGAVLARAGCNRKAAYATLAMTLAAEAPDLDTLWSIRGPVADFQHHRGWTHTFLGVPFEAAVVVGAMFLLHRWRVRRAAAAPAARVPEQEPTDVRVAKPLTAAPVRWGMLYGFTLLALLSHLLLDWTNNYGLRPFFPFNPRWYAGSFVFIFEPVIFGLLLLALIAPALFGLINGEVGVRRKPFRGQGWAIFALAAVAALWILRSIEHAQAVDLATTGTTTDPSAPVLRTFASPYPVDPFRWHTVVETPDFYQLGTADTRAGTLSSSVPGDVIFKPATTLNTLVAKRSWLGQVYLDWSSWPVVTDAGPASYPAAQPGTSAVTFEDLRFKYDTFLLKARNQSPLTGRVYLDGDRRVVRMAMDGSVQR
jgi:inner membrane protein